MKSRSLPWLLVIVLLLAGIFGYEVGNARSPVSAQGVTTDVAVHGTAWTPQQAAGFSLFRPVGWGTAARSSGVGGRWVHIPLTYPTYMNGTPQKLQYLEFCATSSKGAVVRPTQMDVWASDTKILSVGVAWPTDNLKHCFGYSFGQPQWYQDIGISVLIQFGNTTDTITLGKAWLRLTP